MVASLLLTSSPARCEAVLHSCGTSPGCLFYAIAIEFQLDHGGGMMYEMRKPKPTLLPTQGIFSLPHHIGMVGEELTFDDIVSYTLLNVKAVTRIRTPVTYPAL